MANRVELQGKVEQRQKELQQALTATENQGHPDDRINGLKAEMRVAADALQGGWDKVSEVGAQQLTTWLETTKTMIMAPAPGAKA